MLHPSLLRSVLYVPASNGKALAKIATLAVDAAILDLEDAVVPDDKPAARTALVAYFANRQKTRTRHVIRINSLSSPWGSDDLAAAIVCRPDAILLPKVEVPQDIFTVDEMLEEAGEADDIKLWAMIETPRGVLNLSAIAELGLRTGPRLECLVAGTNDLALETGAKSRVAMRSWLSQIVLAARAGHLAVIDGVFNDFANEAGFAEECASAREMGFDGKSLIHPAQIDTANRAFMPFSEDLALAHKIVEAFALPENAEKGVISVNGRMIERLHLEMARQTLAKIQMDVKS
jgi:citrate lyase subunit beta / citryl-CoA lyase